MFTSELTHLFLQELYGKAFFLCELSGLGDEGGIEIRSGYLKAAVGEFQGVPSRTTGHVENPQSRGKAQKFK